MLGISPFKKNLSITEFTQSACQWCATKRIGTTDHFPIPLCGECFASAYANPCPDSPRGSLWNRMMEEFHPEAVRWVKRIQKRDTAVDLAVTAAEARTELLRLKQERTDYVQSGNSAEVSRVDALIKQKTDGVVKLQSDLPEFAKAERDEEK